MTSVLLKSLFSCSNSLTLEIRIIPFLEAIPASEINPTKWARLIVPPSKYTNTNPPKNATGIFKRTKKDKNQEEKA